MSAVSRRTVRNGVIGGVVGAVLGIVPIVLLVAPFIGGGIAGYLERNDARGGAVAGAIAGLLLALVGSILTAIMVAVRFGDLPVSVANGSLDSLATAIVLPLVGVLGQVVVAAVGGALGGIFEATRRDRGARDEPTGRGADRVRPVLAIIVSVVAGAVTFGVVALAVTAVLDPLIWPSAIVGLPVGVVAGATVAIVGYAFLRRDPGRGGHWRAVGLGLLATAAVFALLLGGLWLVGQERVAESYESTYEYEVSLDADGSLEAPTIYVPAPTGTDDGQLARIFVDDVRPDRNVPVAAPAEEPAPVNFSYDLVETEHGPMIAISADRIEVSQYYYRRVENETMGRTEPIDLDEYDPDDPSMGVADDGGFTFTVTMAAEDSIETADPFGTEPLLGPTSDRAETECSTQYTDTQRCYEYESRVYAEYGAADGTTVSVVATVAGRNEWFSGAWSGNEYRDQTAVELLGPQSGWHAAAGELEIGSGSYRD